MDRATANTLPGSVCCAALGSCWASVSPPTSSWTGNSPIASSFGMPMADMPESMAVLGVIKPLILDLPTALGSVIQHATADFCDRGIGEPERFNDLTVRFLLTVEQDPYGGRYQLTHRFFAPFTRRTVATLAAALPRQGFRPEDSVTRK